MFSDPLVIVVVVACLGVAFILARGIGISAKGGENSGKEANKYMRWRIYAQAGAVVVILVVVAIRRMGAN
ncbi:MAG: twin transmembrane helix small protein [Gemmobacter sp.]